MNTSAIRHKNKIDERRNILYEQQKKKQNKKERKF